MTERARPKRLNGDGHDSARVLADELVASAVRGPAPTAAQWAEAITASWQQAVASIIKIGKLLIRAKDQVDHGEWGPLVKQLPFSHRTANCLMAIADHPIIGDLQCIANCPRAGERSTTWPPACPTRRSRK